MSLETASSGVKEEMMRDNRRGRDVGVGRKRKAGRGLRNEEERQQEQKKRREKKKKARDGRRDG